MPKVPKLFYCSDEQLDVIRQMASQNCTLREIAKHFGMCHKTFIENRKVNPNIDIAIAEGKEQSLDDIEQSMAKGCHDRIIVIKSKKTNKLTGEVIIEEKEINLIANIANQKEILHNKRPDQWKDTKNINMNVTNERHTTIIDDM